MTTIPPANADATIRNPGSTQPFTTQWYNFFANLFTGVVDGSNAAAGVVGEYKSAIVPFASGHTMANGTVAQLASVALTAGDWDLSGEAFFAFPGTALTSFYAGWLSNSNALAEPNTAVPGEGFDYGQQVPDGVNATGGTTFEPYTINGLRTRVNITVGATYYLMGEIFFTGTGTITGYGALRARRVR